MWVCIKYAKGTGICMHVCIHKTSSIVPFCSGFLVPKMDMVAATLAGNTLSLVIGSLTVGSTLPRVDENGQAQCIEEKVAHAFCPKTLLKNNDVCAPCLVPLVVPTPVPSSEREREVQEFLQFLESIEATKGVSPLRRKEKGTSKGSRARMGSNV